MVISPDSMTEAFEQGWGVVKSVRCYECDSRIPDGLQYGCDQCGEDFCEECLVHNDQYGHTGWRGEVDSDHPAYDIISDRGGGAHCGECVSEIVSEENPEGDKLYHQGYVDKVGKL